MTTTRPFSSPIDLIKKATSETRPKDAVRRFVSELRRRLVATKGFVAGVARPPYDPRLFAELLGATGVRSANMDVAGRIVFDRKDIVIELSHDTSLPTRRRFTMAHEVAHLALWETQRTLVPNATPRRARSKAVEQLCNEIAAELLIPYEDIRRKWKVFRKGLGTGRIVPDHLIFVENLTIEFRISLQMAAIRFVETCMPHIGFGLLDLDKEYFTWCYRVPDRASLLEFMLAQYKKYSLMHRSVAQDTETSFRGSGSCPLLNRESGSFPVEWKTIGSAANLCLVVAKPQMPFLRRHR